MVAVGDDLYAVEPNHGEVVRISTETGAISRVVDVSASQGHIVPTAITKNDDFFLGNLGTFPVVPGTEKVFTLTRSGTLSVYATGFTTILGLAVDSHDRLYVLESRTQPDFPGPAQFGSGMIVRVEPGGGLTTIATGLTFPTAMTFGPDGALYVSNFGFAGPGAGADRPRHRPRCHGRSRVRIDAATTARTTTTGVVVTTITVTAPATTTIAATTTTSRPGPAA